MRTHGGDTPPAQPQVSASSPPRIPSRCNQSQLEVVGPLPIDRCMGLVRPMSATSTQASQTSRTSRTYVRQRRLRRLHRLRATSHEPKERVCTKHEPKVHRGRQVDMLTSTQLDVASRQAGRQESRQASRQAGRRMARGKRTRRHRGHQDINQQAGKQARTKTPISRQAGKRARRHQGHQDIVIACVLGCCCCCCRRRRRRCC